MSGINKCINVRTVEGLMQVAAWGAGEFAVHGQITRGGIAIDKFSITHVPSGICFHPVFSSREEAIEAAREVNALRDDWASFDLQSFVPTADFLAELRTIWNRHGGVVLPPPDGDRRTKLARQIYATDLNGYGPKASS